MMYEKKFVFFTNLVLQFGLLWILKIQRKPNKYKRVELSVVITYNYKDGSFVMSLVLMTETFVDATHVSVRRLSFQLNIKT